MASPALMLNMVGLLVAAASGQWVNDFDGDAYMECPPDTYMYNLRSIHDNRYEDRRWAFACRGTPGRTTNCDWTVFLNGYDQLVDFNCPGQKVVTGIRSFHDDRPEDRRFMFRCCNILGRSTRNCYRTEFINDWDGEMNYYVPPGRVIKGAYSVHDNSKEDRRWKLYICDI